MTLTYVVFELVTYVQRFEDNGRPYKEYFDFPQLSEVDRFEDKYRALEEIQKLTGAFDGVDKRYTVLEIYEQL